MESEESQKKKAYMKAYIVLPAIVYGETNSDDDSNKSTGTS
jgi:hypothetical protein